MYGKAVEFPSSGTWLNVESPLTLEKLRGQVVLLDFWTYCCINCIHVLDDLKWLEKTYNNDPFVVIGVHSAKFENEKEPKNISAAIERYEIEHPVFVDNEHYLWDRYLIRAWPSFVLIGPDGKLISKISGEGRREYLSDAISQALREGAKKGILAEKKFESVKPVRQNKNRLSFPGKLAFGESRELFISDSNNNRVLVTELVSSSRAKIVESIGDGEAGLIDGNFKTARLRKPQGIAYDKGRLYIADTENHVIRLTQLDEKVVSTIAGEGGMGYNWNYRGPALSVKLNSPWDLKSDGKYLYVAMAGTHQIWRYAIGENTIEVYAGTGAENLLDGPLMSANFAQPSGLYLEGKRLYVADSEVSAVRCIDLDEKIVKTLVGSGLFSFGHVDGNLSRALLQHPLGIDGEAKKLYVADTYNHAVRRIDLLTRKIDTLVQGHSGGLCYIGDSNCDVLGLFEPNDVKYHEGLLYIADTNNHLVRVFDPEKSSLEDLEIL